MLETTEEILAKKVFYRAALLKSRDVFDLVAASEVFPSAALASVRASASRRDAQLNRLRALATSPRDQTSTDILAIGDFAKMVPTMIGSALAWIESVEVARGRSR